PRNYPSGVGGDIEYKARSSGCPVKQNCVGLPKHEAVVLERSDECRRQRAVYDARDGGLNEALISGLMIRRSRSRAIDSSMGGTLGSSFSARPATAAAAYCTRGAVRSFAGPAPGTTIAQGTGIAGHPP